MSIQRVVPRPIAAVLEQMPARDVSTHFRPLLDQVYAAAKSGAISLDGQNIFVYRAMPDGLVVVEFGVGVRERFASVGRVAYSETPVGDAATTTHWGDYRLGEAHDAVVTWCRTTGHTLAGISWEVYGHWHDDPAKVRTDILYLLRPAAD